MKKDWGDKPRLRRIKPLVYFVVMLLSMLVLSGCGTLQTIVQDGKTSPLAEWIGGTNQSASIPAISNLGDGKTVNLYFPDSTGKALVKEERTIPKTLSLARETVNQWLKGPAVKGETQSAVDPSTTLIDISVKEGVATVDLSREFTQVYGKVSQEVGVYGLVNTLTQFPTVREVKFRIEGKAITKIGNVNVAKLSYRESLVKGASGSTSSSKGTNIPVVPATENSKGTKSVLPDSPSSMNLFSFPPSST
jgi:germination protein M